MPGVIAAFLVESDGHYGLIETGPASTLEVLLEALVPIGGPMALDWIAVSHIHLDHAGAAGQLLSKAPNLVCYVHTIGRRHMVDPSRLLRSAERIYGDRMFELWGHVIPCPEDRVIAVDTGDHIQLGKSRLEVVYSPGHAIHHLALWDGETKSMFTGDVAGVRLPDMGQVRPPTPPPDIDPAAWKDSIRRIRSFQPQTLYLTHFGPVSGDLNAHFSQLLTRLDEWIDFVDRARQSGQERDEIVKSMERGADDEVRAEGGTDLTIRQYGLATPWGMTVDGILHYLNKRQAAPPA